MPLIIIIVVACSVNLFHKTLILSFCTLKYQVRSITGIYICQKGKIGKMEHFYFNKNQFKKLWWFSKQYNHLLFSTRFIWETTQFCPLIKQEIHYVVTNEKFPLLEFVIEPVEPTAFIFPVWRFDTFVFIFTLGFTDNLTLLAPIHNLCIVSVMVASGKKVKSWSGSFKICDTTIT